MSSDSVPDAPPSRSLIGKYCRPYLTVVQLKALYFFIVTFLFKPAQVDQAKINAILMREVY